MTKRLMGESIKKQIAARQQWKCSECAGVLPSTYQVDHTVPLCDGGADSADNATAMCPNCHALKTQNEAIRRADKSKPKQQLYDEREDFFLANGMVRCGSCGYCRVKRAGHTVCPAIEDPGYRSRVLKNALAGFVFANKR